MEFEKQLEEWMKLDYVLPEDLPNIELLYGSGHYFFRRTAKEYEAFRRR